MNTPQKVFLWLVALTLLALAGGIVYRLSSGGSGGVVDPISGSDRVRGNANAAVTLIEYSDFECPACAAFYPYVEELLTKHGTRLAFAYRHFPLDQHKNGKIAARAAEAAGEQQKFWEMYQLLFERQQLWAGESDAKVRTLFTGYARELGIDTERFSADLDRGALVERVERQRRSGFAAGVNATPTFFLNGEKMKMNSFQDFVAQVEAALGTSTPSSVATATSTQ